MGSNDVAETWMPELLTLQVDRKIDNKHSFFETIKAQVDGNCYEDFTITWKDKIIKNSVKTLYNKKRQSKSDIMWRWKTIQEIKSISD